MACFWGHSVYDTPKPGIGQKARPLCFTVYNLINIDRIYSKFGKIQASFILNIKSQFFYLVSGNKMAHIYRMTVPRGQKHSALFAAREHAFHQGKRVNRKTRI